MKQASKAPRPFIKCLQYLQPVSVSVGAYLSIWKLCLIAAGVNHYLVPFDKGSYHAAVSLRGDSRFKRSHMFSFRTDRASKNASDYQEASASILVILHINHTAVPVPV